MLLLLASAGGLPQHSWRWRKEGKEGYECTYLEYIYETRREMDDDDDLTVRVEARGTEKGGPSIGRTGGRKGVPYRVGGEYGARRSRTTKEGLKEVDVPAGTKAHVRVELKDVMLVLCRRRGRKEVVEGGREGSVDKTCHLPRKKKE